MVFSLFELDKEGVQAEYEKGCSEETQQHLSQTSEWQCATVRADPLPLLCGTCVCVVKEGVSKKRPLLSFLMYWCVGVFHACVYSALCECVCVCVCTKSSDRPADRVWAVAN